MNGSNGAHADGVQVITLDNPPVNALSFAYSASLLREIEAAEANPALTTVVIAGAGGIFSGGADVNDFATEPTPETKTVRDVIAAIERGTKTYVAAIDGNALGGGFELALACDYRVGTAKAKLGLPEIKLGLLPGAGGTQRLPRLLGANDALQLMLKGETVKAADAKAKGILDEVVEGSANVVDAAKAYAGKPRNRIAERQAQLGVQGLGLFATPFVVAQAHKMVPPETNGGFAAHKLIDAVQAAIELPFERGLAREARLFEELVRSAPSAALRHVFFGERELSKIPGLPKTEPLAIAKAAVIGGGTMGTGIAITFAEAGIPVIVVETKSEAVEKARETVFGMFKYQVDKGRLTQEEAWTRANSITFEEAYEELGDVDVVVEAVFESMPVKKEVFGKLDALTKPSCILASNTSTLDIDEIASATRRPDKVLGLHFFAPANIMKLLEIVRGKATSAETLTTGIALGKKLRKVGVVSGNAFGFIGNRMLFDYEAQAVELAEEGVPLERIDKVIKRDFGMAMGPFAVADLSGLDVYHFISQSQGGAPLGRVPIIAKLVEQGRLGQKTMKGFFDYDKSVGKGREPIASPDVAALFRELAVAAGVPQRADVTDDEILARCIYPLVNTGAELLRTGIALRPGDIDLVWIYGYGFPPHHGGPMWYADEIGVRNVVAAMERFGWTPDPLLVEIARSGGTIANYSKELAHA
ncbi:3-hydroxyacyl-CoA dehydrogenase [Vulcanimicrobium alpinum]|uniref:3-hydroxyacyl-CoA dehydrogenase n=1 Tax=Vulcanimicrobium alpinum TaxID=3016050 RepID=A0AAN2C8V0_UNVUL|nr:3-hydroxyacyl-CoA dehydrogenase NAD-binding domain-containing protein [Vulcanimicrobium alpinum]BDE05654.1 3-hydroxyacyl-CoA dehydrogenase [Vulcanimicrobium alpinum]